MIVSNFFPGVKSVEPSDWIGRGSRLGPMSAVAGDSAEYDARRRRRVWERDPSSMSDMRSDVRGLIWPNVRGGYGQVAETTAGATAAIASKEHDVIKSILIGTSTGILVWLMTRFIDGKLGLGMRAK